MCQILSGTNPDGSVFSYFQCSNIEERYWQWLAEESMRQAELEILRDVTKLFDPNRIDTRHVRKELGDRNVINLGMSVNKVIKGRSRRWNQL